MGFGSLGLGITNKMGGMELRFDEKKWEMGFSLSLQYPHIIMYNIYRSNLEHATARM